MRDRPVCNNAALRKTKLSAHVSDSDSLAILGAGKKAFQNSMQHIRPPHHKSTRATRAYWLDDDLQASSSTAYCASDRIIE